MNKTSNNKKIYLVGGAVRDKLMGITLADKDFVAVGYTPEDFAHLERVGKDFPVFLQEDGSELALARVERKTSSGYNGFETDIQNVTLEQDLSRRDLTINSIAYDQQNNCYIDPYNGQKDIQNKILRHTTEAFCEDPLRVLRLARFRARFGYKWKIHPSTKILVGKMKNELSSLQPDRVYKEIDKVLALESSHIFFETLFELGVLDAIFPSIYKLTTIKEGSLHHMEASIFVHTMMVLENLKDESALLKLTALYHDIAKPYCYENYGNGAGHENKKLVEQFIDMQIPTKIKRDMLILIDNHSTIGKLHEMKAKKIATFFEKFRKKKDLMKMLIRFKEADNLGRITENPKTSLDKEKLLKTLDNIASYSPKAWIDSLDKKPNTEQIKQHIHKKNIEIVQNIFIQNV
jgi:tRNA nucleotidyltransferase (CCA-adding enzyme)